MPHSYDTWRFGTSTPTHILRKYSLPADRESCSFLSPTLRHVQVNHWDSDHPSVIDPSSGVRETLLHILRLPQLDQLDLMDTSMASYEDDPEVVDAFRNVAARLMLLFSLDFTTLRPVFEALSRSPNLTSIFFDLSHDDKEGHCPFEEISARFQHQFLSLRSLAVQCRGSRAIEVMQAYKRPLETLDFRIHGHFEPEEMRRLTSAMHASALTLRVFRCSSSEDGDHTNRASLYDALAPLRPMHKLRQMEMDITVHGEDMLKDQQIEPLFRSWPDLAVWTLRSDPEDGTPVDLDTPAGYGLTLRGLTTIHGCCTRNVQYTPSRHAADIRLTRCHAHNRRDTKRFLATLWPRGHFNIEDCMCEELDLDEE